MTMRILTLNAGSASHIAKIYAVDDPARLEPPEPEWEDEVETSSVGFAELLEKAPHAAPDGIAHRVVHAGLDPTIGLNEPIDERITAAIEAGKEFAPGHNGLALEGIDAARRRFPNVPQFAIFDRGLSADAPAVAQTLPLPRDVCDEFNLRRMGFHGISHHDVRERVALLLGTQTARAITIHLGSGCSMAAFDGSRMIETTMGLTPLEGLMMGARSGSIDPGVIFFLLRRGHRAADVEAMLNKRSGLLGVSGISLDTRDVIRAMDDGDARARLGFDLYVYRLRANIGAMAAVLGGVEAVAWSGPVGEHMPRIRGAASAGLGFLRIAVDPARNARAAGEMDLDISAGDARARSFVIRTLEEWAMARRTAPMLAAPAHGASARTG